MHRAAYERIFRRNPVSLPVAVADHLAGIHDRSWDDILVVLPTRETGRRIVDVLLAATRGRVIFPPRFATPFGVVPFGEGDKAASPLQARLAWRCVLMAATDCPLTLGETSPPAAREILANSFVGLTRDLAAANHNIPTAAKILEPHDARWSEWNGLWEKYTRLLARAGLRCPAEAQLAAARHFIPPVGINRILVAGVYDLPPLACEALASCRTEILVYAPGVDDPRAAFNEVGHACPEFWSRCLMPLRSEDIFIVPGFGELAAKTAAFASGNSAIISGDHDLSMEICAALEDCDGAGFMPEGTPISRHPVPRLAILLTRLASHPAWETLESLLRHPDFLDFLERDGIWHRDKFADWNALGDLAFRPSLPNTLARLGQPRDPGSEDARIKLLGGLSPLLAKFRALADDLRSSPTPALRRILADIYSRRDMARRPGDKEAAKVILRALDDIMACPELVAPPDAVSLAAILSSLPGTWTPEKPVRAIEIQGWLELAAETAPTLIIAGLNEGLLPTKPNPDPLLPDTARKLIGLDHAASRYARDAAMLHSALSIRPPGDVRVFSVLYAADGGPLKPSRLLLRVPDADLPARILDLLPKVTPPPAVSAENGFSKNPLRIPRPHSPARSISVTDFSAYLKCPLRFYLAKRLFMRVPDEIAPALQPARFGSWLHAVLHKFGNDPDIRDSTDAGKIREFLLATWDSFFVGLDLDLQREAGRMRLEKFAAAQASLRAEGWSILHTEWNISPGKTGLQLPGWPLALTGRIDRIDTRGDSLRLIDYKTGGTLADPKKTARADHLQSPRAPGDHGVKPAFAFYGGEVWHNLQLPLYALAVEHILKSPSTLAYFLLPEDIARTGINEWNASPAEMESAAACALAIAREVAADSVLTRIAERDFRSFAVNPPHDDFEPLALSRFIEKGALEVAP